MLYVNFGSGDNDFSSFHCGDTINGDVADKLLRDLTEVQADGDEALFIISNFTNLPHHNGQIQNWYGDTAKQVFKFFYNKALKVRYD